MKKLSIRWVERIWY